MLPSHFTTRSRRLTHARRRRNGLEYGARQPESRDTPEGDEIRSIHHERRILNNPKNWIAPATLEHHGTGVPTLRHLVRTGRWGRTVKSSPIDPYHSNQSMTI